MYLVVIPCLYGAEHTREALESISNQKDVHVLIIDNGADNEVKAVIERFSFLTNVYVIRNKENVYVNPAWQQGINFFLGYDAYTHLIIMNSDLIMQKDWAEVLRNRWAVDPDEICIPNMIKSKHVNEEPIDTALTHSLRVHEGTAGVFITLNRKQCEMINPLPIECKVWFGDQWIYEILRGVGYKTVIPENLISYHYWSQNVSKVKGISEIIEKDKEAWSDIVNFKKEVKINGFRQRSKTTD